MSALGKLARLPGTALDYAPLDRLGAAGMNDISGHPVTIKILLEGLLRESIAGRVAESDLAALAAWPTPPPDGAQLPFRPSRVLMQDFTGVPAAVDLAAMRAAVQRAGGNPAGIEPLIPVDLVIDHSVQVDAFGTPLGYERNIEREYERNAERYALLRWAQQAFKTFRVVPPGMGICHQVNLERLSRVVQIRERGGAQVAIPDTLMGTDSHTTMVNGLGVLGWGVGGIEAEAAMLDQPTLLPAPIVVGVRLGGRLPLGTTATDLVLTLTELLRRHGVVDKFVEFCGAGLSSLSVADRATLSNMCPEYGATASFFPVDAQSLRYLEQTGREPELVQLVERYTKAQGLFRTDSSPIPAFNELIELDLASVEPSVAGPKRPQDLVPLGRVWESFVKAAPKPVQSMVGVQSMKKEVTKAQEEMVGTQTAMASEPPSTGNASSPASNGLRDGAVVIAAITSCTNTSNPSVMLAAGLLAKKAIARGLKVKPTVKTSLAPGSRVVTRYLDKAGLTPYLERLGFYLVGYGCTTCVAGGTPVLMADGTARPIEQLPRDGGSSVFGPAPDGGIAAARQSALIAQGLRECVSLVLQDGRTLICTPDHEILRADGRWIRADELRAGKDRVIAGLEGPLDISGDDETGYELCAGELAFAMRSPEDRQRTLAFARLLGHLLDNGSLSVRGHGRVNVGQAVDRETVLQDIERVTGKRPAASRYDKRKWSIVLPAELSRAIIALQGVRVGRRGEQAPALPVFILDERCPRTIIREFLGGAFGADGIGPVLKRLGARDEDAILEQPAYSRAVRPEHVTAQREVMNQIIRLLSRCEVRTEGARIHERRVRRAASSCPAAQDDLGRLEVRLELAHGLSFITQVGFRYCVDKSLRASAAAVYWRTVESIRQQRQWVSARITALHLLEPTLSFAQARQTAAGELGARETLVFPHYSTLQGIDRFSRLPTSTDRAFRPLHRDSGGFPSPVEVLRGIGARDWFAPVRSRASADFSKRYGVDKQSLTLPTFTLRLLERRAAGTRDVFDLSIDDAHAFIAAGVTVHNCIGNSGPLATDEVERQVKDGDLNVVAVLSGNRNFEGRIHPLVRSSYLASPPLVVAYALAGTVEMDLVNEPLGTGEDGQPVFLRDVWPSSEEVGDLIASSVETSMFENEYAHIFDGDEHWRAMAAPTGALYRFDAGSTYVQEPPFFGDVARAPRDPEDISGGRVLAVLGDSITTDHISPAGSIAGASPAGRYLVEHGVAPIDFNSYGARRGNHEVMVRGTFANIRLRNALVAGKEGWWTRHFPSGDELPIYDAAMRYLREAVPTIILAGKEYGSGSSRDWAAKGPNLLGVKAVIAESYERIHRSNLVGMGIVPLQFRSGESVATLGLSGQETYRVIGLAGITPRAAVRVEALRADGAVIRFETRARVDDPTDVAYVRNGGILPLVLREVLAAG